MNAKHFRTTIFSLGLVIVSLTTIACRDKDQEVDPASEAATADFDLQLEIEREMLEVERERLALERAQLEEARDAALAEADSARDAAGAAEEEAKRARQDLARANSRQRSPAPSPSRTREPQPRRSGGDVPGSGFRGGEGPGANSDYRLFYEELRPHGVWFETGSYGYVWQPEIARRSRDWRPYTQGSWRDTDQGWAWWSDEPFGWATYHYGRWTLVDNVGWIWVPGPDWAPAWVSWRESQDHIGWAPLPPVTLYETRFDYGRRTDTVCGIPPHHYNFVQVDHFAEPLHHQYVPPVQNVRIIQETTNVTNIHVHNETVIVNGPRPEPLRERFGRERMPHHTLNRNEWSPDRRSHTTPRQQGGVLEFLAPAIAALGSNQARPSRLEGRLDQLVSAHPVAKPDAEITQRFVRERARQEVRATPVEASSPSTASPAASDEAPKLAKDVEEIQQTIREREARIEKLTRRQENAAAAAGETPTRSPVESETEPSTKPEPESDPVPEPSTAPEPESDPVPEPSTKPEPESDPVPAPSTKPEPESEPVPEPSTKPEPESAPVSAPSTKPEPESAPVPEPSTKPEPESDPVPEPSTKPEPESEPVPEPSTAPKSEAAAMPRGSKGEEKRSKGRPAPGLPPETGQRPGAGRPKGDSPGNGGQNHSKASGIESRKEEQKNRKKELRSRPAPKPKAGESVPMTPVPEAPQSGADPAVSSPVPELPTDAPLPEVEPEDSQGEAAEAKAVPDAQTMPSPATGEVSPDEEPPVPPQPDPPIEGAPSTGEEEPESTDESGIKVQDPKESGDAAAKQARKRAKQKAASAKGERRTKRP